MYGSLFSRDIFVELDRLQRSAQRSADSTPGVRAAARSAFPALNIRSTAQSVELFAFAPGLDPDSIDVRLDRGLLTVAGQRKVGLLASEPTDQQDRSAPTTVHINERFSGAFSRQVALPEDVDPDGVSATYTNGVLRISVKRKEAVMPRRIAVNA